ncbi:MAG: M1 family aminopeptidase [Candidatus Saccharicenans sp.]|nr:MAG: aminopeptidase [Candidatus Aminicenantes bacterium]HEK86169.1 aminopeptidase [Candidatus Aminicenantes bacterium]
MKKVWLVCKIAIFTILGSGILFYFTAPILIGQQIDFSKKPRQWERSRTYDARHYLVKINIDVEGKAFEGEAVLTLSSLRPDLKSVEFDAEDFKVEKVTDEWGKPLSFNQTDNKLFIKLERPYSLGEVFSIIAFYRSDEKAHKTTNKKGLRFFEASSDHPALVASDSWPDGVHHWFPCYDFPNDKVTDEIIATIKEPYKVASNGRLVSVEKHEREGTVTYHWLQDKPHSTYLIFLAAAPYEIIRDHYETIPINYWVFPQQAKDALRSYEKTPKMMEFFIKTFGTPYPWDKYDQISVPLGGGAESTSATAMTYEIIHDEKAEKDFPSIGIVSHELAHQWWGDLITLRSWEHAWLNESFGTYSDYLYYEYDRGPDEGAINLLNKKNAYLREARTKYIRPIVTDHYDSPQDLFDAHSYQKGACVLHMLRFILGDQGFFQVLKEFLHKYAFQPVDTHDFMKTVKEVTGENMDWFFEQWLFRPGHPVFEVESNWDETRKTLSLTIKQVQDNSRGIPIYKTPILIGIRGSKSLDENVIQGDQNDEIINKIWITEKENHYEFHLTQKPLLVRFDRGNYLLKEWTFPKSVEELLYQARHDDVIGRMWAVQELGKYGDKLEVVKAIQNIARSDDFWAVRREAVEIIGAWKNTKFIPFLKEKCQDKNSQVRASALKALGDFGQASLAGFFRECFSRDDSYVAQAEALKALGKTGDKRQIDFLEKASAVPSYRNIIRNAALEAIRQLSEKQLNRDEHAPLIICWEF